MAVLAVLCVMLVAAWLWMTYTEERVNEEEREKEDLR